MRDSDEDEDLDLSWIETTQKIINADKNYEKELLEYITFHYCYVNNTTIQKIITEKHYFSDKLNTSLSSEFLNTLIKSKLTHNHKQYLCTSVSSFFVNLESEQIQPFVKTASHFHFFNKSIDLSSNFVCPPTIFVFHSLNSLFFLFEEAPPLQLVTKSIMTHMHAKGATKKRVTFNHKTCKVK
jgi:hypothetical protein